MIAKSRDKLAALTATQRELLVKIATSSGQASNSELAIALDLYGSTLAAMLDGLEERGYIARSGLHRGRTITLLVDGIEPRREANPWGANAVAKQRRCLACGHDFPSDWAGHRICDPCKADMSKIDRQVHGGLNAGKARCPDLSIKP